MSSLLVTPARSSASPAPGPAFLVGCDAEGHWLAVETHGLGGGIFRDKQAALHYACAETGRRIGAVQFSDDVLSLAYDGPPPRAAAA